MLQQTCPAPHQVLDNVAVVQRLEQLNLLVWPGVAGPVGSRDRMRMQHLIVYMLNKRQHKCAPPAL